MAIVIICGISLLLIMMLVVNAEKDSKPDNVFYSLISIPIIIGIFLIGLYFGYYIGQTRALEGKFDYKMEIKYEFKDSVYIPADTTFTGINH